MHDFLCDSQKVIQSLAELRTAKSQNAAQRLMDQMDCLGGAFTYFLGESRRTDTIIELPSLKWASGVEFTPREFANWRNYISEGHKEDRPVHIGIDDEDLLVHRYRSPWEITNKVLLITDGEMSFRSLQYLARQAGSKWKDFPAASVREYQKLIGLEGDASENLIELTPRFHRMVNWMNHFDLLPSKIEESQTNLPREVYENLIENIKNAVDCEEDAVFGINMFSKIAARVTFSPKHLKSPELKDCLGNLITCFPFENVHYDTSETDRLSLLMAIPLEAGIRTDVRTSRRGRNSLFLIFYGSFQGLSDAGTLALKLEDLAIAHSNTLQSKAVTCIKNLLLATEHIGLSAACGSVLRRENVFSFEMVEHVGHLWKNALNPIAANELIRQICETAAIPQTLKSKLLGALGMTILASGTGTFIREIGRVRRGDEIEAFRESRLPSNVASDAKGYTFGAADEAIWQGSCELLVKFLNRVYRPDVETVVLQHSTEIGGPKKSCNAEHSIFEVTKLKFPPVEDTNDLDLRVAIASVIAEPVLNALRNTIDRQVHCQVQRLSGDKSIQVSIRNAMQSDSLPTMESGFRLACAMLDTTNIGNINRNVECIDGNYYYNVHINFFPQFFLLPSWSK